MLKLTDGISVGVWQSLYLWTDTKWQWLSDICKVNHSPPVT